MTLSLCGKKPGAELKGYDKYAFRQQHDGYISKVVAADLTAGTFDVSDTWYRVSNPSQVRMLGDAAAVVNSVSDSALLKADGSSTLIDLGEKYVAFARISDDGANILLSNGSEIRIHPLNGAAIGEPTLSLETDKIPGPAERVTSAAESADGTLYLGTSAYRLLKVDPGASMIEAVPVY